MTNTNIQVTKKWKHEHNSYNPITEHAILEHEFQLLEQIELLKYQQTPVYPI